MENLKDILNECIKFRGELKLKISDDVIWANAVNVFISNKQDTSGKTEYNTEKMRNPRPCNRQAEIFAFQNGHKS